MEVIETRYPFDDFVQFVVGGYYLNIAGVHLLVGFCGLIIGVVALFLRQRDGIISGISILYFALQPFNNPAFTLGGLSIADFCGIFTAVAGIFKLLVDRLRVNNWILTFLVFAFVAVVHGLIVWNVYPAFDDQIDIFARLVIIGKIFVFLFAFAWIYSTRQVSEYLPRVAAIISNFMLLICLVYSIQLAVFFLGHLPYGTFTGSGSGINVAFGGVSIERGHLSKFMAPLFVPIAVHCYISNRYWKLGPYLLIMLINFSASGLSFLVFQLICLAFLFPRQFLNMALSWRGITTIVVGSVALIWFADAYSAIIEKIYRLAIVGDPEGGRGVGVMIDYFNTYPLGIGYSGSTYRTAPGLAEINMGLYEFLTQLSVLSLPFLWIFLSMTISLLLIYRRGTVVARLLLVVVLALPLIFAADSLWFVPLWWLPAFVLYSYRVRMTKTSDEMWKSQSLAT